MSEICVIENSLYGTYGEVYMKPLRPCAFPKKREWQFPSVYHAMNTKEIKNSIVSFSM